MATSTEVAIATTTLSSAASSITFSSIPSTYTDLRVVQTTIGTTNAYPVIRFNSDSGSNYSATYILGNGSAASSQRDTNSTSIIIEGNYGATSTVPSFVSVDILSYAGSTYKTTLNTASIDKNGSGGISRTVGLWRSTSAVTSITIVEAGGSTFAAGTTATLYGIL